MNNIEKHLEEIKRLIDNDKSMSIGVSIDLINHISAIESELEDKLILPKTPTEQQLDRAVALMLNWKVTSQNGGWTEYAKQLYETMIKED